MKRRDKSQGSGSEVFLEAVAAGREASDQPEGDLVASEAGNGVAEQRALVAEDSLRQMRAEAERRLADARTALEQERALRHEAEAEVRRLQEHLQHGSEPGAVFAPSGALRASTDSVPPSQRVQGAGSSHGVWPSPWLAEES